MDYLTTVVDYLSAHSSSIVSMLTLIGIITGIATLLEMIKERRESYKPRLMFQNKNFFLEKNSNGTPCFLKETVDKEKTFYGQPFPLELANIGLGSAHNIEVKWQYDESKFIDRLRKYVDTTKQIRQDANNHFQFIFKEGSHDGYGFSIETSEEEKTQESFVRADTSIKLRIPETIHNFITFTAYLELVAQGKPIRADVTEDEIKILLTYYDIGGKKQTQKFDVTIKEYAYTQGFPESNYGLGTISFSAR